jgi:transcriptional regulator with XRE-family HTH domain
MSQSDVADAAKLSVPTIKRAESDGGIHVSADAMAAIAAVLEKAGVEFIPENGSGAGVRMRKRVRR